jgi:tetratricopeptide (TPR) repeat protein
LEAETLLEQAIMIRKEIGNDEGVALALNNLGNLHRITGQYDQALSDFKQSYDINIRIDHPEQTFSSLVGLSALNRDLGEYDQSVNNLARATEILPKTDSYLYIDYLIHTSLLKTFIGEPEAALDMSKEALERSKDLPWFHAPAAKNIGHAFLTQGKLEKARQYFQQAVNYYKTYHQIHLTPEPLAGLARIALLEGTPEQAFALIQEFLPKVLETSLQGLDRLIWTYLVSHIVLAANNDPQAPDIIQKAYQILLQRAETIADEKSRQSYLTGIRDHYEVIQIGTSLSKPH